MLAERELRFPSLSFRIPGPSLKSRLAHKGSQDSTDFKAPKGRRGTATVLGVVVLCVLPIADCGVAPRLWCPLIAACREVLPWGAA